MGMKQLLEKYLFKERKSVTYLWKTLKVLVFFIFIYTAFVMFKLRDSTTAIFIIFAVSFFLIFNKIDSINKRLKVLEEK